VEGSSARLSELIVSSTWLGFTLVTWLRRLSGDEEREKVVHDVGGRNTRNVCMVVCRCDFDNVRTDKVEARKAPDDPFDLARRPATCLWRTSYEKLKGLG